MLKNGHGTMNSYKSQPSIMKNRPQTMNNHKNGPRFMKTPTWNLKKT